MVFKFIIGDSRGKAWRMEREAEFLVGKSVGDVIEGKDFGHDFEGYEFEIRGGTDFAGFPLYKELGGIGLGRVLLTKGWGMRDNRKGVRLKKTVRGKIISDKVVQINMRVVKEGKKNLSEIFPEQNIKKAEMDEKKAEVSENKVEAKDAAANKEEVKEEQVVVA